MFKETNQMLDTQDRILPFIQIIYMTINKTAIADTVYKDFM